MQQAIQNRRAEHANALERGLADAMAQLKALPQVHKIVLFGSYAAGRRDMLTDLDLLVVIDSEQGFVERNAELAGRLHVGVALDLLAYTPAEMEQMQDRPFMRHALASGKVLYERCPAE